MTRENLAMIAQAEIRGIDTVVGKWQAIHVAILIRLRYRHLSMVDVLLARENTCHAWLLVENHRAA